MIFVYGGAYQGQEEYAKNCLGATEIEYMTCESSGFDAAKRAFADTDAFVLGCVRRGESAQRIFEAQCEALKDAVIIGKDFSGGIVPMDAETRLWREENGRLNNAIAARADHVIRMFCGIAQVLK